MTVVEINKKYYSITTTWNELTGRQLVRVMHIFNVNTGIIAAQVHLFKALVGISWLKLWWVGPLAIEDNLYLTDWLFNENTLTENLLPKYRHLYGPAEGFNNLQVCEFIFTEQYYQQYKEDNQSNCLHYLIAILYRPAKRGYNKKRNEEGDVREPYNDNLTGSYAHKIARWPMPVKQAILFWYEGCRNNLVKNNNDVFGGAGGDVAKYGLWSVMRGVAEKAIHGDITQVEKIYVNVFMMELNEIVAESNRIAAAYK